VTASREADPCYSHLFVGYDCMKRKPKEQRTAKQ